MNSAFFATTSAVSAAASGTEYDGSTYVVRVTAPVTPGSVGNVLKLAVADAADTILDSAVFVSSLQGLAAPVAQAETAVRRSAYEIDPATGDVLRTIPLPAGVTTGSDLGLGYAGGSLYVLDAPTGRGFADRVFQVDVATAAVQDEFDVPGTTGDSSGLAAGIVGAASYANIRATGNIQRLTSLAASGSNFFNLRSYQGTIDTVDLDSRGLSTGSIQASAVGQRVRDVRIAGSLSTDGADPDGTAIWSNRAIEVIDIGTDGDVSTGDLVGTVRVDAGGITTTLHFEDDLKGNVTTAGSIVPAGVVAIEGDFVAGAITATGATSDIGRVVIDGNAGSVDASPLIQAGRNLGDGVLGLDLNGAGPHYLSVTALAGNLSPVDVEGSLTGTLTAGGAMAGVDVSGSLSAPAGLTDVIVSGGSVTYVDVGTSGAGNVTGNIRVTAGSLTGRTADDVGLRVRGNMAGRVELATAFGVDAANRADVLVLGDLGVPGVPTSGLFVLGGAGTSYGTITVDGADATSLDVGSTGGLVGDITVPQGAVMNTLRVGGDYDGNITVRDTLVATVNVVGAFLGDRVESTAGDLAGVQVGEALANDVVLRATAGAGAMGAVQLAGVAAGVRLELDAADVASVRSSADVSGTVQFNHDFTGAVDVTGALNLVAVAEDFGSLTQAGLVRATGAITRLNVAGNVVNG
ncbi:MAG: hypothetical protein FJ279_32190, partial [Planctomycetes bacterium]|nr:hypothetical protein [Planctomycetota bacterium]